MALTKFRLCNMKEAELRTDTLIPLFKAMGFRDVRHYHGGTGEQGRDIVMWWPGPLGDREYHAVVAKAAPISGQATGRGSAGEVFMQISQALGSTFTDPSDLATRIITRCLVVTPHAIRKEAAESIRSALGPKATEGVIRFIDGDWEGHATSGTLHVKPGALPDLLRHFDPSGANRIVVVREEWFEAFGEKFPLGTVVRVATHMTVAAECRTRIDVHPVDQAFELELEPKDEQSTAWIAFLKWLDETQLAEVRNRLPGVDLRLPEDGGESEQEP